MNDKTNSKAIFEPRDEGNTVLSLGKNNTRSRTKWSSENRASRDRTIESSWMSSHK